MTMDKHERQQLHLYSGQTNRLRTALIDHWQYYTT